MAFNINAQVVLSGPKNLNKISKQIQQGIGKSGAIKVAVDPRSLRNIRSLNTTVSNLNNNISSLNKSATTLRSTLSSVNNGLSKANSSSSAFNKNQQQTASSVNNVNKALQQQSATLGTLGKRFLSTAKTAIAFGLISRPIYDLQRAFVGATKDAVQFQREIVKISQVTGTSVQNLTGLTNEVNKLATTLGVSANELAETSRIIAQTGRSAAEIQPILNALARSTLAPTFGKITDTTEGLIAALGQFQLEAGQSEVILGSLNKVSKSFAVEAEDLISVIRRTGGVFAQAAGDSRNTVQALQELAAIFTAVRSTTRESADTIAAGLRTIFSRIQRRGTIEFLEQFGVQLTNIEGEFIGIFPAFDELSNKLSTLIKQGDALTLSAIAEELGGIRQIGKLLPAIAQFDKARAALEQAQKGAVEGLGVDVAKGLDTVDNRIRRVKESFDELIRTVFESDSFQNFTRGVLSSAETILQFGTKVVEALEPILPLLQGIGAVKLGQALGGFVGGGGVGRVAGGLSGQAAAQASQAAAKATQSNTQILTTINTTLQRSSNQLSNIFQSLEGNFRTLTTQMSNLIQAIGSFSSAARASSVAGFAGGVRRRSGGGKILGFNRGGMVPGTGNRDTVPAMLQPGEFVIKKSSVNSLGADTLQAMNKYAGGGVVIKKADDSQFAGLFARPKGPDSSGKPISIQGSGLFKDKEVLAVTGAPKSYFISGTDESAFTNKADSVLRRGVNEIVRSLITDGDIANRADDNIVNDIGVSDIAGKIFEGVTRTVIGDFRAGGGSQQGFDVRRGLKPDKLAALSALFNSSGLPDIDYDNKLTESQSNRASLLKKANTAGYIEDVITLANFQRKKTTKQLIGLPKGPDRNAALIKRAEELQVAINKLPVSGLDDATRKLVETRLKKERVSVVSATPSTARKNKGGSISGQDTVPALLTPGEFVFNKNAASRIGYGNLNRMNKKGIQGFNKGGVVGFNEGGKATGGSGRDFSGAALGATFALQSFTGALEDGVLTSQELNNIFLSFAPTLLSLKLSNNNVTKSNDDVARSNSKVAKSMSKFERAAERGRISLERATQLQAKVAAGEMTGRERSNALLGKGRFAGASLGIGIAASAVGSAMGGTAGGAISGAGQGIAIGSLLGPVGTAIGALGGAMLGLEKAIEEQETQAREKAFSFALEQSSEATQKLEKAILENVSSTKLLANTLSKSEDLSVSGRGAAAQAIDTTEGMFNEDIGIVTNIGVAINKTIDGLGRALLKGSITQGFEETRSIAQGNALTGASDQLNKLGDAQLKNLTAVSKATNLNLENVDSLHGFKRSLEETSLSTEQQQQALKALQDVTTGIIPEYQDQINALRASGKITKEQTNLARRMLFTAADKGVDTTEGQGAIGVFRAQFKGLIDESDIVKEALNQLREGVGEVDQQLDSFNLQKPLQLFNMQLNEVTKTLKLSNAVTQSAFDNFDRSLQTLSGNFQSISQVNPFDFQGVGAGNLKLQGISQIGRQTGADVGGLEATQRGLNQVPQIAQQLLLQTEGQESFRAEEIAEFFQKRFEQQQKQGINAGLPDEFFVAFIGQLKDSLGRQGADIPAEVLRNAIQTDQLDDIFGKIGADSQAAFSELFNSVQEFNDNFAQQVNVQAQILTQQKEFDLSVLQKRQQLEGSLNDILGRRVSGGFGAARENLQGQVSSLAGTSDPTEIFGRLLSARSRLSEIRQSPETASLGEASNLTSEIQTLTKSLNLLGNDTTQLAAIQQEANKIQQQQIAAQSSLEGIILGAASGDAGAISATVRQQDQLFRTLEGGGSIQDQVAVLQNLQNADFATLVDAIGRQRGVEGGAGVARETLVQNLTKSLRGTALGQRLGPTLDVLSEETKDTSLEGLAAEANNIANEQLTILKALAGIETETKNDLAKIGANQLKAQEDTIKQQTAQLNFLNKSGRVRGTAGRQQALGSSSGPPTSREIASGVTAGGIPLPSAPASTELSPFERAVMGTGVAAEEVLSPATLAAEKARKAEREQKLSGFATSVDSRAGTGNLFAKEQRRQQEAFLRVQESGTPAQQRQLARRQEGFAATPFQQQQQQKRAQFQFLQESRRIDVGIRKGEIDPTKRTEQLQAARKRLGLSDGLGFDKAKQEQQLKPGEVIKNSLVEGSTEGARKYEEVFSKLPESIKVELQPIEILGTDSIGTAIGDQLLPKIQEILQPLINQNEGLENPDAGAGIN